ncbi:MAG: hypothetical protein Crog4KO_31360 [Crocinitomicaceae bacterium]
MFERNVLVFFYGFPLNSTHAIMFFVKISNCLGDCEGMANGVMSDDFGVVANVWIMTFLTNEGLLDRLEDLCGIILRDFEPVEKPHTKPL